MWWNFRNKTCCPCLILLLPESCYCIVDLSMLDLSNNYLKCCNNAGNLLMLICVSNIQENKWLKVMTESSPINLIELWMSLLGWYWPRWSNIWVIFQTCKMFIFNFPVVCLANIIMYLPSVYFSEVMTSFFVQRPWCNAFLETFKHLNAKNEWKLLHSI